MKNKSKKQIIIDCYNQNRHYRESDDLISLHANCSVSYVRSVIKEHENKNKKIPKF